MTGSTEGREPMESARDRRDFLRGAAFATAAGALIQPYDVMAMAEKDDQKKIRQSVSEHARPTTHPADVHKLPRWVPKKAGNFDLRNPRDNHLAFAKVQANLAGGYSWLANYGWIVMAPPGKPAFPILGRLLLSQIFITPATPDLAPDPGPDDYVMWGTFSTVYVDPRSFEPVSRILNPYNGKMIDVPKVDYADKLAFRVGKSILVPGVDPAFYTQPWDRDGGFSQHFIDTGENISYTVLGASQQDGAHQPRCDIGFWTVTRADLINSRKRSIDTQRDYSATFKVSEYAWYGVEKGDPAQLLVHMDGLKTHDIRKLPSMIRKYVLEPGKDRFVV